MFSFAEGYHIEGFKEEHKEWPESPFIENSVIYKPNQIDPSIYRLNFYGRHHKVFLSYYGMDGPIVVAVHFNADDEMYKVLYLEDGGITYKEIPRWAVFRSFWRMLFCKDPSYHHVYQYTPKYEKIRLPRVQTTPQLQDELLKVFEPDFSSVMKVGLLYCKANQTNEYEMLSNTSNNTSAEYEEFLSFLGDKVELKGFTGYNGGLDVNYGNSGKNSIYTKYNDVEIMFHVSTMLPHYNNDVKQIEKKKHIGNDRIMIVFNDGPQSYLPSCMKSKQTQTIILIQPLKDEYSLENLEIHTGNNNNINIANNNNNNTKPSPAILSTPVVNDLPSNNEGACDDVSTRLTNPTTSSSSSSTTKKQKPLGLKPTQYIISIANKASVPSYDPQLPSSPVFYKDDHFRRFLFEKMINGSKALRKSPVFQTKTSREQSMIFHSFTNKYTNMVTDKYKE